jgi:hypothetical protein
MTSPRGVPGTEGLGTPEAESVNEEVVTNKNIQG